MKKIPAKNLATAVICATTTLLTCMASAAENFTDMYTNGSGWSTAAITGSEPSVQGTYPVFVYMVGTWEDHENASAMSAVNSMAERGYVAATVEYSNSSFGDCPTLTQRSKYIFDAASTSSAIAKICARSKADCDKGIVVAGFSQGSVLGMLSKNYDGRVEAVYGMGAGVQYDSYNLRSCVADGNRALPSDRLRAANGEADGFMGGDASAVKAQLEELTGLTSTTGYDSAFRSNDSGWYLVAHTEVEDGEAEHCYMRTGGCGFNQNRLDSIWTGGASQWSLEPNLDWLTRFTR